MRSDCLTLKVNSRGRNASIKAPMFIVRSNVIESFEYQTPIANARSFFSHGANYIGVMPNLESIHTDERGVTRWNIAVEVPLIGRWKMPFAVDFLSADDIIEWYPAGIEKLNFLRCVTELSPRSETSTMVRITHNLELRRKHATELHALAGLAGERMISREMESEVTRMLKVFMVRAKEKLEN